MAAHKAHRISISKRVIAWLCLVTFTHQSYAQNIAVPDRTYVAPSPRVQQVIRSLEPTEDHRDEILNQTIQASNLAIRSISSNDQVGRFFLQNTLLDGSNSESLQKPLNAEELSILHEGISDVEDNPAIARYFLDDSTSIYLSETFFYWMKMEHSFGMEDPAQKIKSLLPKDTLKSTVVFNSFQRAIDAFKLIEKKHRTLMTTADIDREVERTNGYIDKINGTCKNYNQQYTSIKALNQIKNPSFQVKAPVQTYQVPKNPFAVPMKPTAKEMKDIQAYLDGNPVNVREIPYQDDDEKFNFLTITPPKENHSPFDPATTKLLFPNGYDQNVALKGGYQGVIHDRLIEIRKKADEDTQLLRTILSYSKFGPLLDAETALQFYVGKFDSDVCAMQGIGLKRMPVFSGYTRALIKDSIVDAEKIYLKGARTRIATLEMPIGVTDPMDTLIDYIQENPRSLYYSILRDPDPSKVYLTTKLIHQILRTDFWLQGKSVLEIVGGLVATAARTRGVGLIAVGLYWMFDATVEGLSAKFQKERVEQALLAHQIDTIHAQDMIQELEEKKINSAVNLVLAGVTLGVGLKVRSNFTSSGLSAADDAMMQTQIDDLLKPTPTQPGYPTGGGAGEGTMVLERPAVVTSKATVVSTQTVATNQIQNAVQPMRWISTLATINVGEEVSEEPNQQPQQMKTPVQIEEEARGIIRGLGLVATMEHKNLICSWRSSQNTSLRKQVDEFLKAHPGFCQGVVEARSSHGSSGASTGFSSNSKGIKNVGLIVTDDEQKILDEIQAANLTLEEIKKLSLSDTGQFNKTWVWHSPSGEVYYIKGNLENPGLNYGFSDREYGVYRFYQTFLPNKYPTAVLVAINGLHLFISKGLKDFTFEYVDVRGGRHPNVTRAQARDIASHQTYEEPIDVWESKFKGLFRFQIPSNILLMDLILGVNDRSLDRNILLVDLPQIDEPIFHSWAPYPLHVDENNVMVFDGNWAFKAVLSEMLQLPGMFEEWVNEYSYDDRQVSNPRQFVVDLIQRSPELVSKLQNMTQVELYQEVGKYLNFHDWQTLMLNLQVLLDIAKDVIQLSGISGSQTGKIKETMDAIVAKITKEPYLTTKIDHYFEQELSSDPIIIDHKVTSQQEIYRNFSSIFRSSRLPGHVAYIFKQFLYYVHDHDDNKVINIAALKLWMKENLIGPLDGIATDDDVDQQVALMVKSHNLGRKDDQDSQKPPSPLSIAHVAANPIQQVAGEPNQSMHLTLAQTLEQVNAWNISLANGPTSQKIFLGSQNYQNLKAILQTRIDGPDSYEKVRKLYGEQRGWLYLEYVEGNPDFISLGQTNEERWEKWTGIKVTQREKIADLINQNLPMVYFPDAMIMEINDVLKEEKSEFRDKLEEWLKENVQVDSLLKDRMEENVTPLLNDYSKTETLGQYIIITWLANFAKKQKAIDWLNHRKQLQQKVFDQIMTMIEENDQGRSEKQFTIGNRRIFVATEFDRLIIKDTSVRFSNEPDYVFRAKVIHLSENKVALEELSAFLIRNIGNDFYHSRFLAGDKLFQIMFSYFEGVKGYEIVRAKGLWNSDDDNLLSVNYRKYKSEFDSGKSELDAAKATWTAKQFEKRNLFPTAVDITEALEEGDLETIYVTFEKSESKNAHNIKMAEKYLKEGQIQLSGDIRLGLQFIQMDSNHPLRLRAKQALEVEELRALIQSPFLTLFDRNIFDIDQAAKNPQHELSKQCRDWIALHTNPSHPDYARFLSWVNPVLKDPSIVESLGQYKVITWLSANNTRAKEWLKNRDIQKNNLKQKLMSFFSTNKDTLHESEFVFDGRKYTISVGFDRVSIKEVGSPAPGNFWFSYGVDYNNQAIVTELGIFLVNADGNTIHHSQFLTGSMCIDLMFYFIENVLGSQITTIKGDWGALTGEFESTNHIQYFNNLIDKDPNDIGARIKAAQQTWTAQQFKKYGFEVTDVTHMSFPYGFADRVLVQFERAASKQGAGFQFDPVELKHLSHAVDLNGRIIDPKQIYFTPIKQVYSDYLYPFLQSIPMPQSGLYNYWGENDFANDPFPEVFEFSHIIVTNQTVTKEDICDVSYKPVFFAEVPPLDTDEILSFDGGQSNTYGMTGHDLSHMFDTRVNYKDMVGLKTEDRERLINKRKVFYQNLKAKMKNANDPNLKDAFINLWFVQHERLEIRKIMSVDDKIQFFSPDYLLSVTDAQWKNLIEYIQRRSIEGDMGTTQVKTEDYWKAIRLIQEYARQNRLFFTAVLTTQNNYLFLAAA